MRYDGVWEVSWGVGYAQHRRFNFEGCIVRLGYDTNNENEH